MGKTDPEDTRSVQSSRPTSANRGLQSSKAIPVQPQSQDSLLSLPPVTEIGREPWVRPWYQKGVMNLPNRIVWPGNYPTFELKGPDPQTKDAIKAVSFWLRWQKNNIINAEKRWRVDRTAIAGVIAWEALFNPQSNSVSSVGPGKIHIKRSAKGDLSWPEVVEGIGKMPRLSPHDRNIALAKPEGAINYIGAIFDTASEVAGHYVWDIRRNPELLALIFHSYTFNDWLKAIQSKKPGDTFIIPPGTMGEWVDNNQAFLKEIVGVSAFK